MSYTFPLTMLKTILLGYSRNENYSKHTTKWVPKQPIAPTFYLTYVDRDPLHYFCFCGFSMLVTSVSIVSLAIPILVVCDIGPTKLVNLVPLKSMQIVSIIFALVIYSIGLLIGHAGCLYYLIDSLAAVTTSTALMPS